MFRSLKNINKEAQKYKFFITLDKTDVVATREWQPYKISVSLIRRKRKETTQARSWHPSIENAYSGIVNWTSDDTLELVLTLFKDKRRNDLFEKKDWVFLLENEVSSGKRKPIATYRLDFANLVTDLPASQKQTMKFKPMTKRLKSAEMTVYIVCSFLGKPSPGDGDLMSVAGSTCSEDTLMLGNLRDYDDPGSRASSLDSKKSQQFQQEISALTNQFETLNSCSEKAEDTSAAGTSRDLSEVEKRKEKEKEQSPVISRKTFATPKKGATLPPKSSLDYSHAKFHRSSFDDTDTAASSRPSSADISKMAQSKRRLLPSTEYCPSGSLIVESSPSSSPYSSDENSVALLLWCQSVTRNYAGVKVTNFTTSWRNGLALCALVHHFLPEKINFDELKKSDGTANIRMALRTLQSLNIEDYQQPSIQSLKTKNDLISFLCSLKKHFGDEVNKPSERRQTNGMEKGEAAAKSRVLSTPCPNTPSTSDSSSTTVNSGNQQQMLPCIKINNHSSLSGIVEMTSEIQHFLHERDAEGDVFAEHLDRALDRNSTTLDDDWEEYDSDIFDEPPTPAVASTPAPSPRKEEPAVVEVPSPPDPVSNLPPTPEPQSLRVNAADSPEKIAPDSEVISIEHVTLDDARESAVAAIVSSAVACADEEPAVKVEEVFISRDKEEVESSPLAPTLPVCLAAPAALECRDDDVIVASVDVTSDDVVDPPCVANLSVNKSTSSHTTDDEDDDVCSDMAATTTTVHDSNGDINFDDTVTNLLTSSRERNKKFKVMELIEKAKKEAQLESARELDEEELARQRELRLRAQELITAARVKLERQSTLERNASLNQSELQGAAAIAAIAEEEGKQSEANDAAAPAPADDDDVVVAMASKSDGSQQDDATTISEAGNNEQASQPPCSDDVTRPDVDVPDGREIVNETTSHANAVCISAQQQQQQDAAEAADSASTPTLKEEEQQETVDEAISAIDEINKVIDDAVSALEDEFAVESSPPPQQEEGGDKEAGDKLPREAADKRRRDSVIEILSINSSISELDDQRLSLVFDDSTNTTATTAGVLHGSEVVVVSDTVEDEIVEVCETTTRVSTTQEVIEEISYSSRPVESPLMDNSDGAEEEAFVEQETNDDDDGEEVEVVQETYEIIINQIEEDMKELVEDLQVKNDVQPSPPAVDVGLLVENNAHTLPSVEAAVETEPVQSEIETEADNKEPEVQQTVAENREPDVQTEAKASAEPEIPVRETETKVETEPRPEVVINQPEPQSVVVINPPEVEVPVEPEAPVEPETRVTAEPPPSPQPPIQEAQPKTKDVANQVTKQKAEVLPVEVPLDIRYPVKLRHPKPQTPAYEDDEEKRRNAERGDQVPGMKQHRKSRPLSQADTNLKKRLSKLFGIEAPAIIEDEDDEISPKTALEKQRNALEMEQQEIEERSNEVRGELTAIKPGRFGLSAEMKERENQLTQEWLQLVNKKNRIVLQQHQISLLDDEQRVMTDLEENRKKMEKFSAIEEEMKTEAQKLKEAELLEEKLRLVNEHDRITQAIDEKEDEAVDLEEHIQASLNDNMSRMDADNEKCSIM